MKQHTGIGDWIATSYESGTPFLQQVPRDCADFLLLNAQIREYDAGEIIINGDSEGMAFCVLQSGRAQICGQILPDGHYSVLAYIESGGCFGEMSIICNEPTSNTVIAAEDGCTVLIIPRDEFVAFLEKNPSIMVYLYKVVAGRLRAKNKAFPAGFGKGAALYRFCADHGKEPHYRNRYFRKRRRKGIYRLPGRPYLLRQVRQTGGAGCLGKTALLG